MLGDEIVGYLEKYAASLRPAAARGRRGHPACGVRRPGSSSWPPTAGTVHRRPGGGRHRALPRAAVPRIAERLPGRRSPSCTPSQYRNPEQLPDGRRAGRRHRPVRLPDRRGPAPGRPPGAPRRRQRAPGRPPLPRPRHRSPGSTRWATTPGASTSSTTPTRCGCGPTTTSPAATAAATSTCGPSPARACGCTAGCAASTAARLTFGDDLAANLDHADAVAEGIKDAIDRYIAAAGHRGAGRGALRARSGSPSDGRARDLDRGRSRRGRLGHRLPPRPPLDRGAGLRRPRLPDPRPRRHQLPRPVLPRPALAVHLGLGPLRRRRRATPSYLADRITATRRRRVTEDVSWLAGTPDARPYPDAATGSRPDGPTRMDHDAHRHLGVLPAYPFYGGPPVNPDVDRPRHRRRADRRPRRARAPSGRWSCPTTACPTPTSPSASTSSCVEAAAARRPDPRRPLGLAAARGRASAPRRR